MIEQRTVSCPASGSRRGRPPSPLEPSASAAARLGAELRALRTAHDLTLAGLSVRVGYSAQYISQAEHGRTAPSEAFVRACDVELGADGALMLLLPAVILEQAQQRSARIAARRGADIQSDAEVNVEAITRRELVAVGSAAVVGMGAAAAPASVREVDPALPGHWERLLGIIGTHDAAHGPHAVLGTACRELRLIATHRAIASGDLRTALMRVEGRWAVYAGWLCEDTGDPRERDALLERALCLAREADEPDLMAWARARQAQWTDPRSATRIAETGLRTPRTSPHTRALCALRAAYAHAHIGNADVTRRAVRSRSPSASRRSPGDHDTRSRLASPRHAIIQAVDSWLSQRRDAAIDAAVSDLARRLLYLCAVAPIFLLAILPPYISAILVGLLVILASAAEEKKQITLSV
jgi:transcriptional regulator with XRE-family HTH domain